jgi:hypothetical protein
VARFCTPAGGGVIHDETVRINCAAARRLQRDAVSMNSEIRLQKSRLAAAGRALLVIAVIAAWTVAVVGLIRDREPEAASNANPRIEKKAPAKPYYSFMIETPV